MIVVTTPTGNIGKQVLSHLLDSGETVRVIARDVSKLPAQVRQRIDVVQGSHNNPATLEQAFTDADTVFWLAPPDVRQPSLEAVYTDFVRPACEAFKRKGVQRVVGVSTLGRDTPMANKAGIVSASLAMDDLIAASGVSYHALTMPSFMDNLLQQVEPIKTKGMFFSPIAGDRKAPVCAIRDIAAVAAKHLLDRSWSGVAEVPVLGPEDLSMDDMAAILSEVLGKPVRFLQISFEDFKARLRERGVSEAFAQAYDDMVRAKNDGIDNSVKRTPQGTTPTSFRQWSEEVLKPAVAA